MIWVTTSVFAWDDCDWDKCYGFCFPCEGRKDLKDLKNTMHICLASVLNSVLLLSGQWWHEQSALLFLCQAKHLSSSMTFRKIQNWEPLSRGRISEILPHMMNTRYFSRNLQLIRNEHGVHVLSWTYSECCHTQASLCRYVYLFIRSQIWWNVDISFFFILLFMVCLVLRLTNEWYRGKPSLLTLKSSSSFNT